MAQRKKPQDKELEDLLRRYQNSTHRDKLALAEIYGVSYDTLRNWINQERKPIPPPFERLKSESWEAHIVAFKQMDELTAFHQRVPEEITIPIETELPIGLTFTADWQLGMFGVDYDSFERDIPLIESEPGLYCYVGGDGYQNVIQPSKVGSGHNQIPVAVQRGLYVLTLEKLRHKILAIGTGNHNYWTQLADGEDWDMELARRLRLVYTKHGGKIYLKVGDMTYLIFRIHKGRFESTFNPTHPCKQYQRLYCPDARIVAIEHRHVGDMEMATYNDNECVYIRTGTYAVYDDYAQQQGFFGAEVANPTVILFPHQDKIIGFKHLQDAVVYLRTVRATP